MRGLDRLAKEKKKIHQRQDSVHTRTADDPLHLRKEKCRLEVRVNTFSQRVVNSWNKIGFEQKSKSLAVFKSALNRQQESGGRPNESNKER